MAQQQTAQSPVGGLLGEKERRLLEKSVIVRLVEKSGLKPIGDVAQRLLAVLSGPEPDTENVCRLFERDPSLASNVLRIANSPLYRAAETIDDIRTAVVRLGFEAVKELVIVHVHNGILKDSTATASFYRAHSAACAAIARELAAMFAPEEDEGLFSSGLLHDVGKLVLLQGGQQLYKTTLDATDMREPEETLDLERAELGYDHAALGGLVLEHWAIPSPVPEVVALHHVDTAKIEIEHLVK
ncbi:MAG: HDOD domain-containing protein, partial [Deltaproteobacteria bacterium]